MPCLFLNTERGFGGKPPQKSGFRRHLAGSKMPKEGSKMPKETFFHGDLPLENGLAARARCLGFLAGVAAGRRPRSSATATMQLYFRRRYLVPPGDGVLRKAVQAERQPYSGALLQHTSKRSPLAATNLVCLSGIQHIDLIRQYRGAGIDLPINGDRNDVETRELFASDVMPHFA